MTYTLNFKNGIEDCLDFTETAFPGKRNLPTTTTTTSFTPTPTSILDCNPRIKLSDLAIENEDLAVLWTLVMNKSDFSFTHHCYSCNLSYFDPSY